MVCLKYLKSWFFNYFVLSTGVPSLFCVVAKRPGVPWLSMAPGWVHSMYEFICTRVFIPVLWSVGTLSSAATHMEKASHPTTDYTVFYWLNAHLLRLHVSRFLCLWSILCLKHDSFIFKFLLLRFRSTKTSK